MTSYASYAEWAADYSTQKVHAVEMTVARVSDGATLDLFWTDDSSGGAWDGSHFFEPYIKEIPRLVQKAQKATGGRSLAAYGNLVLGLVKSGTVDPAGGVTWNALLSEYAFWGRPITVKVGGPGLDYAKWGVVLAGYMGQPSYNDQQVSVPVYSKAKAVMETEVPANVYDDAFPDSTQGKVKPVAYGQCKNIRPVLIDEAGFVYQFHDAAAYGAAQAVDAVYVNGLQVTSGFTVDLAAGTVDFGVDPKGTVTLDVRGAKPGGTYIHLVGDILREMLIAMGGVDSSDLDAAAFAAYNAAVPFTAGIYLSRKMKLARAIDSLVNGLLTIWGPDRRGLWGVRRFTEATGDPNLEVTDLDILANTFSVKAERRLYWKVAIAGDRNWSVNSNPHENTPADRVTWLAEKFREREASSSAVQALYPDTAQEKRMETHLADLADCATVAGWWLGLFGARRRLSLLGSRCRAWSRTWAMWSRSPATPRALRPAPWPAWCGWRSATA